MELTPATDQGPIRLVVDERLDFNHFKPPRKSYIVAACPRSGSQYFCWKLWQTGLLGAPSEILNPGSEQRVLMNRLKSSSPADYIAKLMARRTSRNGIFGLKTHFQQFEPFLKEYPALLEVLSPVVYIYLHRQDKVAQAVSMAKAQQTGWWTSRVEKGPKLPLRYDRDMIANCLATVELQDRNWRKWFAAQNVTPFEVAYTDLTADTAAVVRSIVELLGVQNDEPDDVVNVPPVEKQGDETNEEWIARFQRETRIAGVSREADVGGVERDAAAAGAAAQPSTDEGHFVDRNERLVNSLWDRRAPTTGGSRTHFVDQIRLRRRYDAIIAQNRGLLHNARVLDIMTAHGFWSLAALDAGAAHVVGVETSQKKIKAAAKNFRQLGVKPESYQLINSTPSTALQSFNPEQFDVILCDGWIFGHCEFPEFFAQLTRLRPKHVVLDTEIRPSHIPLAHFSIAAKAWKERRSAKITATPSHELIALLCEPEFRWRLIDWNAMGITDWAGISDYARNEHRTYVLDHATAGAHFFDRCGRMIRHLHKSLESSADFVDLTRLRHRYDAIVGQNRDLFRNARVLDIMSAHGFWTLAALDAGAAHVVSVETWPETIRAVDKAFRKYGIWPESYQFINSEISSALETFNLEQFDMILCDGTYFERCRFLEFFDELSRLRPKHVILDTDIALGQGPLAHFSVAAGRSRAIKATPNRELIAFLCESEFRWRLIDWKVMGITDWTGIQDYAGDTHRTYVLYRL